MSTLRLLQECHSTFGVGLFCFSVCTACRRPAVGVLTMVSLEMRNREKHRHVRHMNRKHINYLPFF